MARRRRSRRPYTPRKREIRYLAGKGAIGLVVVGALVLLAVVDRLGVFGRRDEPDQAKYHEKSFRVVRVVDGDTLDVGCPDGDRKSTRIRLWGVDTPETVKPDTPVEHFGPEATAFVKQVAGKANVKLHLGPTRTRDKYGRLLAYLELGDGRDLNREIIATGHGYADPRFPHPRKDDYRHTQDVARRAGLGLWAEVRDDQLPSYYRGKLRLTGR